MLLSTWFVEVYFSRRIRLFANKSASREQEKCCSHQIRNAYDDNTYYVGAKKNVTIKNFIIKFILMIVGESNVKENKRLTAISLTRPSPHSKFRPRQRHIINTFVRVLVRLAGPMAVI